MRQSISEAEQAFIGSKQRDSYPAIKLANSAAYAAVGCNKTKEMEINMKQRRRTWNQEMLYQQNLLLATPGNPVQINEQYLITHNLRRQYVGPS